GDPQPDYPGYYATDWGIAVGAVDNTNTMADFSNKAGTTPLDYVVAPGVDILSTIRDEFYQAFNGTSMAAPHVAGVAALMLNANSSLTPTQVEDIITATANSQGITV
ncbi:MAG TPA: S8 family serine peptidase, partial [Coleofasciculaceae cyanobacterium]